MRYISIVSRYFRPAQAICGHRRRPKMDKTLLSSVMVKNHDTQRKLAEAMGLSLSRFNAKINERDGAEFTQTEMTFIISRYKLSNDEAMKIFFAEKVSN